MSRRPSHQRRLKPVAQCSARDFHAVRVANHAGHRQPDASPTISLQLVFRQDSRIDHRRLEKFGAMPDQEIGTLPSFPCRIVDTASDGTKVADHQIVGMGQRSIDGALDLHFLLARRVSPNSARTFPTGRRSTNCLQRSFVQLLSCLPPSEGEVIEFSSMGPDFNRVSATAACFSDTVS